MFCGAWGVISCGFFAVPQFLDEVAASSGRGGGVFYGKIFIFIYNHPILIFSHSGFGTNLGAQCIMVLVIFGWSVTWSICTFGLLWSIDRYRSANKLQTFAMIRSYEPEISLGKRHINTIKHAPVLRFGHKNEKWISVRLLNFNPN